MTTNKISFSAFQTFDGNLYGFELIGFELSITYCPKNHRFIISDVHSGQVYRNEVFKSENELKSFQQFAEYAKKAYLRLIEDFSGAKMKEFSLN